MGFTKSAIIDKNTPEILKRLDNLGYSLFSLHYETEENGISICTSATNKTYSLVNTETAHNPDPRYGWACYGRVCCGTDEELFFKTIQEIDN